MLWPSSLIMQGHESMPWVHLLQSLYPYYVLKKRDLLLTRIDVYETLCPQQMLVHKGGQIENWSGECRDIIPTKLQCQTIQRALQNNYMEGSGSATMKKRQ